MPFLPKPVETVDGTGPDSAGDVDLSGTFAPLTDRLVTLDVSDFFAGAAARYAVGPGPFQVGVPCGAAGTSTLLANFNLPPSITAVNVDLLWVAAVTGDVVWRLALIEFTPDSASATVGPDSGDATVTCTSAGVNAQNVDRILTQITVDPAKHYSVYLQRVGGDAADTLAGDADLVSVWITPG